MNQYFISLFLMIILLINMHMLTAAPNKILMRFGKRNYNYFPDYKTFDKVRFLFLFKLNLTENNFEKNEI